MKHTCVTILVHYHIDCGGNYWACAFGLSSARRQAGQFQNATVALLAALPLIGRIVVGRIFFQPTVILLLTNAIPSRELAEVN